MDINHPHFIYMDTASHCFRSKATGQCVILAQRGEQVVAIPATITGERLPVHAEPIAWAATEWDCLDAVHAQR